MGGGVGGLPQPTARGTSPRSRPGVAGTFGLVGATEMGVILRHMVPSVSYFVGDGLRDAADPYSR